MHFVAEITQFVPPAEEAARILAIIAAIVAAIVVIIRRAHAKLPPDPWPAEVDAEVRKRGAVPVCVNCLYPQQGHQWFCPHCNFPTGEYVNSMPYLYIFAQGELLRRGVSGPRDKSLFRQLCLVMFSAAEYSVLAPFYWFWMWRKAGGKPISTPARKDLPFEETP